MDSTPLSWHTEQRTVSSLVPFDGNPRQLNEKQVADLKRSLEKFNLVEIPAINTTNKILAGHQRLKIMQLLGRGAELIDVRVPNRELTPDEEREYLIRSNKNTGDWDWDQLANFDAGFLVDCGFTTEELTRNFGLDESPDQDEAPDLPAGEARAKRGQVFTLGRHKIMCGDSTDPEDVKTLMGGGDILADLIFTDPPYNVNYSGRGTETSNTIENDNQPTEQFREFLSKAFANYRDFSKADAAMYCCYASRTHREFEDCLNANGWKVRNQIIWVKLVASMVWGDYRWKHEPIFYCSKDKGSPDFFGDRKQYTEWTEEKTDEELLRFVRTMIEKDEKGGSTVWRFKRDSQYKHPTQKPVDLVGTAIKNSGIVGGVVLDLFLGSGSTLIACEKNKRTCYGMELDPKYGYCEQTKTDPEVIYAGATAADAGPGPESAGPAAAGAAGTGAATGPGGGAQETQAPA